MKRESGSLLIEVVIAMTLLTVGLLGYLRAFASCSTLTDDVSEYEKARLTLENTAETLRNADFNTAYANYNWAFLETPGLNSGYYPGYNINAFVIVNCFVDENNLPAEFGPILDLDGSGGLENSNCSATYSLLPVKLSLNFAVGKTSRTMDHYLVLRP